MSSPSERRHIQATVLRLVGQLANPTERRETARVLARELGADDFLVFMLDPAVGAYLPAPGLLQTLPDGRAWQSFLLATAAHGWWNGTLPFSDKAQLVPAIGIKGDGGSLLVVIGGAPGRQDLEELALLLPLLAAAFGGERAVSTAEARVTMLRHAAAEAHTLAEGLDTARRELQRLYAEVRSALQARDAFLASVTHDLKTPLTAVYGYAQLLHRQVRRTNPVGAERLLEGLGQIQLTSIRMRRQVDQLLDVAKLHMGQALELDRRPVDLVALVRAARQEHSMTSDRHRLIVVTQQEQLVGQWDALRLECLLDNLLTNAIKYSPEGGEILVTLDLEVLGDATWAVLAVQDSGIGVPAADLAQIFDRFHRAGNTTRQMHGSGIGLASAQQIVREHGGTIAVHSTQGEGSIFTVRLPVRAEEGGKTREQ